MTDTRWRSVPLKEIAPEDKYAVVGGPFGSKLVSRDYVPDGVPVLRGANLPQDREIELDDLVFVTEEKVEKDLFGNLAHPGDIVVTQRGTLGQIGLLPDPANSPYDRYVVSQSQMKLTVDPQKAYNRFVFYALRSPGSVKRIQDLGMSSGVPHINLDIFRNFEIRLPDLATQCAVAEVLSRYDDLIENNRRRIAILEEMARLIYREWFVHFRFPGHEDVEFVDSDLGPIPEGWEVAAFSDLAEFVNGFAFKSSEHWMDEGLPIVKIKELKNGVTPDTPRYHGDDIKQKYFVEDGDVLFSWSADLDAYVWSGGPALLNQHLFVVRPFELSDTFLFHSLRGRMEEFRARSQGTTMKHIKRSALSEVKTVVPDAEVRHAFEDVVAPMLELQLNLAGQSRVLTAARDLLLPRLISGELDVSDLELDLDSVA